MLGRETMDASKNVLLITNATTDAEIVKIKEVIAQASQSHLSIRLSLAHVIPALPTCYFNIPSMVLLAERCYEEAKQSLTYAGEFLGIEQSNQWLITGRARSEVLRLANKLNTHFILASSTTIPELRKLFIFSKKEQYPTLIRSIGQVNLFDTN
ncbi:MAG: hypothetical protein K0S27_1455 [Gammaproteobacteria bacterium]|jgi:hypothetical protein|nr:hypothetical protein [Gammaproteobacteria bacterium]